MDLLVSGRVALVTGASSGIGEAVALSLAKEGATVALAARRLERLEQVAENARKLGAAKVKTFHFDQADLTSGANLVSEVCSALGPIDILIANGGGPKPGTYLQTQLEDWDRGYGLVLRSMLQLVNGTLPEMRARHWGRIVALTSMSVKEPIPNLVLSNSLRTALVSALKTLSIEVASDGVTINSIATGRILTDRLLQLYGNDEEAIKAAAQRDVPIGRAATPSEFAPLVTFLCGDPASYITGQTIAIDGGYIKSLF
ncbi:MAG TPA: SDR family oxidoreductase [Candidatus Binatia bacterium]|nr:SDR family oxidoreductase [Candidatus Binatia bacterium]